MTIKHISICFGIGFLIVAWVYWLPLAIAIASNTWHPDAIEARARLVSPASIPTLDVKAALKERLDRLDASIAKASDAQLPTLLKLHEEVEQFSAKIQRKVQTIPYANSVTRNYFFASYLGLALLVLSQYPRRTDVSTLSLHHTALSVGVACYTFFNWSNWLRNSPFGQVDRRSFAYAHFDISITGFVLQELQVLGSMILSGYFVTMSLSEPAPYNLGDNSQAIAKHTRNCFVKWQLQSFLIALAYLPWTIFFWRTATVFGEVRYFASAMCIHVVWAFLWGVASLPAWRAYHAWHEHAVNFVVEHSPEESEKFMLIEPVSRSMFTVSALAGTASFIYPLLQSAL